MDLLRSPLRSCTHNVQKKPVDVNFRVGKLQIRTGCKGYGTMAILYSSSDVDDTSTRVIGNFLSQVTLQYDCCEELGMQINLRKLSMELTYHKNFSPGRFLVRRYLNC